MIGAATAIALENTRRREEEEAAQKAAAEANAAAFNAVEAVIDEVEAARKAALWQEQKAEEEQQANLARDFHEADDASMEDYAAYQARKFREADDASMDDYAAYQTKKFKEAEAASIAGYSVYAEKNNSSANDVCYVDQSKYEINTDLIDISVGFSKGVIDAERVSNLKFTNLESGYISVSADTPIGTRLDYKQSVLEEGFDFTGTRYLPSTVVENVGKGLLEDALGPEAILLNIGISIVDNSIKYGKDSTNLSDFLNKTAKNQEFWSSVAADIITSFSAGILAALIVTGLFAAGVALGITAPVWIAVLATSVIGVGLGLLFNYLGVSTSIKNFLDNEINLLQE